MNSKKSVLIIADPMVEVPPVTYGGVERIIALLIEGLSSHGWDVTLACHPDSAAPVKKVPLRYRSIKTRGRLANAFTTFNLLRKGQFDLVHSFAHLDAIALMLPLSIPKILSFQAAPRLDVMAKRFRLLPPKNLWFTTCGRHMVSSLSHIGPTFAIHNGVTLKSFTYQSHVATDAPLVFLGRIEPIKGTHHAIHIAKQTNRKLIIAGNRSNKPEIDAYFKEQVEPHLSDQITYIGPVDDIQKNELLGKAAAFLMPIEWDEPFGIVMAEALACGTPVIGFNRGALPEIVEDGITGACCDSIQEMIDATLNIDQFSRERCRKSAEENFAAELIVDQYIKIYEKVLAQ